MAHMLVRRICISVCRILGGRCIVPTGLLFLGLATSPPGPVSRVYSERPGLHYCACGVSIAQTNYPQAREPNPTRTS